MLDFSFVFSEFLDIQKKLIWHRTLLRVYVDEQSRFILWTQVVVNHDRYTEAGLCEREAVHAVLTIEDQECLGGVAKLQCLTAPNHPKFCCLLRRQNNRGGNRSKTHVDVVGDLLCTVYVQNALESFLGVLIPRSHEACVSQHFAGHRQRIESMILLSDQTAGIALRLV